MAVITVLGDRDHHSDVHRKPK